MLPKLSKSIIIITPHLLRPLDPPWVWQHLLQVVVLEVDSVELLPQVWQWALAQKSLTRLSEELWEVEAQAMVITNSSKLLCNRPPCSRLQFSMLNQEPMPSQHRRTLAIASINRSWAALSKVLTTLATAKIAWTCYSSVRKMLSLAPWDSEEISSPIISKVFKYEGVTNLSFSIYFDKIFPI